LRTLGQISTEFARDTADISDRENVQYHWIRVEDMPEIWKRLDSVGLQTTEACGDCPRVVLGSPLAGDSVDEVIDGTPAIDEIVRRYIGKPEYSNLPRKFKTAISGLQDVVHEVNDVAFIGVDHPEHGPGFDLWVGGGLSTNPMLGQRVGAWVPLDEVPDVWEAVVSVFRDYGYRRLRSKARLKFLIKDWGVEKFREVLETEYLKRRLIDGPAPEPVVRPIDHVGVQRLKNGLNAVGVAPIAGRVSGTILTKVADLAEQVGSDRIRFTPYQKLVILDVPDDRLAALVEELDALGLPSAPSHWRRNLMACTGIEFCKLSFAETRKREAARGSQRAIGRSGHRQHQRLPELVRAHPGRRYRVQGPGYRGRRRRPHRGVPGTPRWKPRTGQRFRTQTAPAQGDQRRVGRLHRTCRAQLRETKKRGRAFRAMGTTS
jgi:sulfite reductase (ferredoxin)